MVLKRGWYLNRVNGVRWASLTVFASLYLATYVQAELLCPSGSPPQALSLSYCTEYISSSCCDSAAEADIQAYVSGLGATPGSGCEDQLKAAACAAACSPYARYFTRTTAQSDTDMPLCRSVCTMLSEPVSGACANDILNGGLTILADCSVYPAADCFGNGHLPSSTRSFVIEASETQIRGANLSYPEEFPHNDGLKLFILCIAGCFWIINMIIWLVFFGSCSCRNNPCCSWTVDLCGCCKAPPYESELTLRIEPAGEPFSPTTSRVIMGRTPIPSGPQRRRYAAKLAASTSEVVLTEELSTATKVATAALSGAHALAVSRGGSKDQRRGSLLDGGGTFEVLRSVGLLSADGTAKPDTLAAALSGDIDDPILVDPLMQRGYLLARPAIRAARIALLAALISGTVLVAVCAAPYFVRYVSIPVGPTRSGLMGMTIRTLTSGLILTNDPVPAVDPDMATSIVTWQTQPTRNSNSLVKFQWELLAATGIATPLASLVLWSLLPMTQLRSYPFWLLIPSTILSTLYVPILLFASYRGFDESLGLAYDLTRSSNVAFIENSEGAIYTWPVTLVLTLIFPVMIYRVMRVIARHRTDSTLAEQPGLPVVFDHHQMNDLLRYLDATKLNLMPPV